MFEKFWVTLTEGFYVLVYLYIYMQIFFGTYKMKNVCLNGVLFVLKREHGKWLNVLIFFDKVS